MCHGQKSGGANTKYLVFWIGGICARFLNFKNKTNVKKLIFKNLFNYLKFYVSIILFDIFLKLNKYTVTSLDVLCFEKFKKLLYKIQNLFCNGWKNPLFYLKLRVYKI